MLMDHKISFNLESLDLIDQKLQNIDSFRDFWPSLKLTKTDKILKELREISTIESIAASTRIEGSTLSDAEVAELISNLDITKLKSRDQEEVIGYYETLDLIIDNYESIYLSESYIKQLHSYLLKYSSKDTRHIGNYKSLSNKVIAKYPDAISKVIFNTTEPYLVVSEMEALILWTNTSFSNPCIHPLLVIGAFTYEFLSIHPFQDGNGRLSRLLTNFLMLKFGYGFITYISFEKLIEDRKKEYYTALMEGQKHRYDEKEDISKWMIFFLDAIENLILRLQIELNKYEINILNDIQLNPRQRQIFQAIKKSQGLQISALMKEFPQLSRSTIANDLKFLMKSNLISRSGRKKSSYYHV